MTHNKNIFLCTGDERYTHKGSDHQIDLCIDSFKHLKKKNSNINLGFIVQSDVDVDIDIPVFKTLNRDSKSIIDGDKRYPFMNDMLNCACDISSDIFVVCNSDIIVSQKLIDLINNTDVEAFGVTRTEILPIQSIYDAATIIRNEPAGFDCWVVSKQWWTQHRNLFCDMLVGQPHFDVIYTLIMLMNSKNHYISNNNYLFHIAHQRRWSTNGSPYSKYNYNQSMIYTNFEPFWDELCTNTFWRRMDPGKFLQVSDKEIDVINKIKCARKGCLDI